MSAERSLIVFPISHTAYEAGITNHPKIEQINNDASLRWKLTLEFLSNSDLNYKNLQVYQDNLVEHNEIQLLARLLDPKNDQSPNAKVLLWLIGKGARLMPTEDREIMAKWNKYKDDFNNATPGEKVKAYLAQIEGHNALMPQRDRFIGRNISNTLDEQGLLFIGLEHSIGKYMDLNIKLSTPRTLHQLVSDNFKPNFNFSII